MKINFSLLFCLLTRVVLSAQSSSQSTTEFVVTGKVKSEVHFSLKDLKKFTAVELNDVNTSCSPKVEEKMKSVKAILLKEVLDSVSFQYENRRMLNQYYFLFVAADGYKVVFSFNEIYNTDIGKNLFLIVETDGKSAEASDQKIQMLSIKDIKAGARNVKWLSKIVVCSAE